jgi:putative toxin-antitoxin system antitoxin component (TIGR02293 family)
MHSNSKMANLLGIAAEHTKSAMSFADRITAGLPVASLARVCDAIAPADKAFKYRIVGKSSLARRQKSGRLSVPESEKLARVAFTWSRVLEIWKNEADARMFLFRPHMLLQMRPAIDVALQSEFGASEVTRILGELEAGVAI